jgi:hypothetical protein
MDLILNDRINVVQCPACGFSDRLPFAFMATNVKKAVAIWYEPYPDPHIDSDLVLYRKHYGTDCFWARAPRIQNWAEFKRRLVQLNSQPDVPATVEDMAWLTKGMKSSATEFAKGTKSSVREKVQVKPNRPLRVGDKIASLVDRLRAKGHEIPSRVSEIPGFPCQNFDALRTKLSTGQLILYRPTLNYSYDVFAIMATRSESAAFKISVLVMSVLPLLIIALAIFVHWPWALLCPFPIYAGWRMGRSTYTKAILRSAAESEMNFCFLFYGYKVGVALPDFSKEYVWEGSYPAKTIAD